MDSITFPCAGGGKSPSSTTATQNYQPDLNLTAYSFTHLHWGKRERNRQRTKDFFPFCPSVFAGVLVVKEKVVRSDTGLTSREHREGSRQLEVFRKTVRKQEQKKETKKERKGGNRERERVRESAHYRQTGMPCLRRVTGFKHKVALWSYYCSSPENLTPICYRTVQALPQHSDCHPSAV